MTGTANTVTTSSVTSMEKASQDRLSRLWSMAGYARFRLTARPRVTMFLAQCLATLLVSTSSANAQWFWQNPLPQRNSLNDVDFLDTQTGMAVGGQGAIIRTDDGGRTWSSLEGGWSDLCGSDITAVSLADTDTATTLLLSTCNQPNTFFDAIITKTTDGGGTWASQFTSPNTVLLDLSFNSASEGTAVGGEIDLTVGDFVPAVLRTVDGGNIWNRQTVDDVIGLLYGVDFTDSDIGVAVGSGSAAGGETGGLLLRTSDGGVNWAIHFHNPTIGSLNDVTFLDANRGIAVGDDGVVLTTTDAGETWIPQDTGTDRKLKAVSCIDAMSCVAVGGGVGGEEGVSSGRLVLRTTDGGITWDTVVLEENGSTLSGVSFQDDSAITAVGWRTEEGVGAILSSADGGATWTSRSRSLTNMDLNAVSFADRHSGVAVGEEGTILGTADGGNTWNCRPSETTQELRAVSMVDAATAIIVGNGTILRTTNGGNTWTSTALAFTSLYGVSCTGIDHCTAVGSTAFGVIRRAILRTDDGGDTWTTQLSELDESDGGSAPALVDVSCADPDHCVAIGRRSFAGFGSLVLRTVDAGQTWSRTELEDSIVLRGVHFTDADTGNVVGSRPGVGLVILRTTDGGATWVEQTLPPTVTSQGTLMDVAFADALTGTVAGGFNTILTTSDGGETWEHELGEPTRGFSDFRGVALAETGTATVVGVSGQIFRTDGAPTFPLSLTPNRRTVCAPEGPEEVVSVSASARAVAGYSGTVSLSTSGEPPGVTSGLNPEFVDTPGSSLWTLTIDPGVAGGRHVMTLIASDSVDQQIANFLLDVVDPEQAAGLLEPGNGTTDIGLQPTFTWDALAGVDEYRIQVATDSAFGEIVIDEEVTGTSFTPPEPLSSDVEYFWRVQGIHDCGGAWSDVFSFATEAQPMAQVSPGALGFELPVGGDASATVSIANVGTGDLVWSIETAQPPAVAGNARRAGGFAPTRLKARNGEASDGGDVMLGLASVVGQPLSSVRPINSSGGVVNCEAEPTILLHDDGTVEDAYSGDPGADSLVIFADRFTPSAYPASFNAVCLAFISLGPATLDFEIVVFDDDGPAGSPGTEMGALPASAEDLPGTPGPGGQPMWFSYDISSLGIAIDSGSMYIGARWAPTDPNVFLAADVSPVNPAGYADGYAWSDAIDTWIPIVDVFPNYRSLFVRAVENPGGCLDPDDIPWLSAAPDAGTTQAGSSTPMEVMVDTTGLDVGEYDASLCIATNDADRPQIVIAVTLTVIGGSAPELTFDPESLDFGDVEVGTTSTPQFATLQNVGGADATGLAFTDPGVGFTADTSACGDSLPAGGSCDVAVTFTPSEVGPTMASLEAASAEEASASLSLSGTGVGEPAFAPTALAVDPSPLDSDGNGVLEPIELVEVMPIWRNDGNVSASLTGTASDFTGPDGGVYSLAASDADYGLVEPAATATCQDTGVCYRMGVNDPVVRPATHWEATFDEELSDDTTKTWTLHIGDSFTDVPRTSGFYPSIETLLHHAVSGGCSGTEYCPGAHNTRAQMPVFVLRALEGADYVPPACVEGSEVFGDVRFDHSFCAWIEELANRGVVAGCGGGNYCPNAPVTRAQMAIFLLRTLEGSDYTPPACTGLFVDVPCPSLFADWIEELYNREVTSGCGNDPLRYCPARPVTRSQMAVFVTKTFGLTLYGP